MDYIWESITAGLKEWLVEGIMGHLSGISDHGSSERYGSASSGRNGISYLSG